MINLIFSFVFTTAKTNLFYARLQKAAAIKSENIRAVRHLEIFLGQTLHITDKETSLRSGKGPLKFQWCVRGCSSSLHLLSLLKLMGISQGQESPGSAPLFLNVSSFPPTPKANSYWEGLGLWSPSSPIGTDYSSTSSLPLTLCSSYPGMNAYSA